jgi:hypothetical protein
MTNKKVYRGLSKIAIATIILTFSGSVVYAKDGDLYDTTTNSLTYEGNISQIILKDKGTLLDIMKNEENYGYEISNKIYKLSDVNNAFTTNSEESLDTIYSKIENNYTPLMNVSQKTLKGIFSSVLGQNYATVTIPAGATVSSVTQNGITVDAANYSLDGTILTILNVTSKDAIKVTTEDGTVYKVAATSAVSSVTSNSDTSFQVKFIQAPADTSKISFNVTRGGAPVTLTTTWDSTNTVATLTYSSSLPQDNYAVDVKDGSTDLGSTNVSVTKQRIAKIIITSTTLGIAPPTTNDSGIMVGGNGYASYKVLDQYGNDMTNSTLAQDIIWTCGIGTITSNNGLLTITPLPNDFLTHYTTATISGTYETTGIKASAELKTLQNQSTLSSITLNSLYCANNPYAVLTAGDTQDSFYIDYTATDSNGNITNNYNLIKSGLMSSGGTLAGLISSNTDAVTVNLVTDPNNSNNALIKITPAANSNAITGDQQVVITAVTSSGKSSQLSFVVHK